MVRVWFCTLYPLLDNSYPSRVLDSVGGLVHPSRYVWISLSWFVLTKTPETSTWLFVPSS